MRVVRAGETDATIELTKEELRVLHQALNEICHGPDAIDGSEFHTRMGVRRDEAQTLLAALGAVGR